MVVPLSLCVRLAQVPIKFLGTGEKTDAIEEFHPDRLASRILGMGDILTLVERAQENIDQEEAQKSAERLMEGKFDLEDFLSSMQQMKRMGPLGKMLELLPGMNQLPDDIDLSDAEGELKRIEAIIYSMTPHERRQPKVIKRSRKIRIAHGVWNVSPGNQSAFASIP